MYIQKKFIIVTTSLRRFCHNPLKLIFVVHVLVVLVVEVVVVVVDVEVTVIIAVVVVIVVVVLVVLVGVVSVRASFFSCLPVKPRQYQKFKFAEIPRTFHLQNDKN